MASLRDLQPQYLWRHFDAIRSIPRTSADEARIREHVMKVASERGWTVRTDQVGNVCVVVPATKGREGSPILVMQAHLDMVCEKDSTTSFDFSSSPIDAVVDGEWVTAHTTTLGADNGIGVAAALAIAEDPQVEHGPLELLFTVDEEATMAGALNLDAAIVHGRLMLNLDSEDDAELVVGCAGGCDTEIEYAARRAPLATEGNTRVRLTVGGLSGGHSGLNIHENRGNAIKVLARVLRRLMSEAEIYIWSIDGGNKPTAIPREASAIIYVPERFLDEAEAIAAVVRQEFAGELGEVDAGLFVRMEPDTRESVPPFDCSSSRRLVRLLNALPSGVMAMSREVPGMVQTSTSLGTVRTDVDRVSLVACSRSMMNSSLRGILDQVDAVSRLAGAATTEIGAYPAWRASLTSPLLGHAQIAYRDAGGHEPRLATIHAGLECGVIAEKLAGVDIISFGPLIQGAHSPGERVNIPSVQRLYDFLRAFLPRVAGLNPGAEEG